MNEPVLDAFRKSLDNIDHALVMLLAERFKITDQVARYKHEHRLPAMDVTREDEHSERIRSLAASADLDARFAEDFLRFIMRKVVENHEAYEQEMKNESSRRV